MAEAIRTVVVESNPIPRRVFRVFVELEAMYRNIVEQLVLFGSRNNIDSFTKLKALKYRELRSLYPHLPSHYAHTSCQDSSTRLKSFFKKVREGKSYRDYPEVRNVSIWLDDHLWKLKGYTRISIATHKGWIDVDLNLHKWFWKYMNSGWKLSSEAKIKIDKRNRKIKVYLTFGKEVKVYEPKGFIPVDVNENNVSVLIDGVVYLFETNMKDIVLGYYYRRKRIQERYDRIFGVNSRIRRKVFRRLKGRKKKSDIRWKIANIVVKEAFKRGYGVVLEKLGKNPANNMVSEIKDNQLRHRIYQASFKGVQNAIVEKAKELGVLVKFVNPKNTSRLCPIHRVTIVYNGSRIGRCSIGGEYWHRDVAACWNLLLKALGGDGSSAPSRSGQTLDVSPMPLGSNAAHEPGVITRDLWARRKSLDMNEREEIRMNIQGQTVAGSPTNPYVGANYDLIRH